MTEIKLCGLTRLCEIEAVNGLRPEYVGFVFYPPSRRCVTAEQAARLRAALDPSVRAVGVFVDEPPEQVAALLEAGVIDMAQLHGRENADYYHSLRVLTDKPVIKAFRVHTPDECRLAEAYPSEYLLLDAGMGDGRTFDWSAAAGVLRPYFLAGGLHADNVGEAVRRLRPFAVDVSSGIETDGVKDLNKMAAFVAAVRKEDAI